MNNNVIRWWRLSLFLLCIAIATGWTDPVITEFCASNESILADEDGFFSDWIEIHNPTSNAILLEGYHLTDDADDLNKWTFPALTLEAKAYMIVFASSNDRVQAGTPLHTNFQLAAAGEYLALVAPGGTTVLQEFAPQYPQQVEDDSFGLDGTSGEDVLSFFARPTPEAPNGTGSRAGPLVSIEEINPAQPVSGSLTVTARVTPVNGPIAEVILRYRKMYDSEKSLLMNDSGVDGDEVADDGIWSAVIPDSAFAPAEMTRWRLIAEDQDGTTTREPPFHNRRDSPEYFGTVTSDPEIKTQLSVLHWFTRSPSGAGTRSGSRGSVYYKGQFYDNVQFSLHGQSSSQFPKKSYNIDFNRGHRFSWDEDAPRVSDIDLITNWADKSKVRHVLAYEIMRESGVAAHFAFTIRVQQNGEFFSTADLIEDADEWYLERAGLNPDGALYKVYDNTLNRDGGDNARSGVEKKTRLFENNDDLQALINGLDLRGTQRTRYYYDHIDIPSCVNLLAANSVIRNIDMHSKNWYIYRDTGRSGQWAILPWDLDLSHGRVWNTSNTYFDNRLYTDGFVVTGTAIRLVSQMFSDRDMRAMIMRRIRTLSDRFLQAPPEPGTPEDSLYYERRLNEQFALLNPSGIDPSDAQLDFEKWGSWVQRGGEVPYTSSHRDVESMEEAIDRWKTEYLPARRNYIYNRQIVGKGGEIPLPQISDGPTTQFTALVEARDTAHVLVPSSGALGTTWTGNPADEPFDTSRWLRGRTGIGYDNGTAYDFLIELDIRNQMRSNTSVYIRLEFNLEQAEGIDQLELRLKYDDGFVAYLNGHMIASANTVEPVTWNSTSRLAHTAHPRNFNVFDISDQINALRSGRNILAIHGLNDDLDSRDMLIVPELYMGVTHQPTTLEPTLQFGSIEPNPESGNQDEEYVQLLNRNEIAVDISNWQLTGAIDHVFAPGTVIPSNGVLYVCPDVATFRARSVSPKGGEGLFVQGGYRGHLSNLGEKLTLLDAKGGLNNEATYEGQASEAQLNLVLSEIMYHPAGNDLAEFIELVNISETLTLDLNGIRFTQGVRFDFTESKISSLPPDGRVLVVRDEAAFSSVYGSDLPVAGAFIDGTALSNGGERLKLEDSKNGTIFDFDYGDSDPWPELADGGGFSLVMRTPESRPDPADSTQWRLSSSNGGTPGRADDSIFPGDPAGDANGNGEADLVDFALGNELGLLPIQPSFKYEQGKAGQIELLLSIPISLAAENHGITVEPYFSSNLITWQAAANHLEFSRNEDLGDGRVIRFWKVLEPFQKQSQLFMQLQVTQP